MSARLHRRSILRGMLGGSAVAMALPLLDCFLNENGTAFAATGAPLPVRFGTWHWGLGMNPARWTPTRTGKDFDIPIEMKALEPIKQHINVFTGLKAILDGKANLPHISGMQATRSGMIANGGKFELPTFDVLVADHIGNGTRFRSLEMAATGDPKHSYSYRNATSMNPAEASPLGLYTRIFGPEFQDPNAAEFKPDPKVMLRQSVLSAVKENREDFLRQLGSADQARLDEYFTSVRQLENQLELQLQKPPPAEACKVPGKTADTTVGTEVGQVLANHKLMAQLLAMALACNQTKIFNMVYSDSASCLRMPGEQMIHHLMTHEEPIDTALGYQPRTTYFVLRSMDAWVTFVQALAGIKEGDGTLLDNTLVFAHSDTEYARIHSVSGIPMMTAGKAGGRIKTGIHVSMIGDPVTRAGFTMLQAMGVPLDQWGVGSMQTSKAITEILV